MAINSFDTEIACQVGVNAAVIYHNLKFWCQKNLANNRHIHDGKVWTYNSRKAFSELFPYLTEKQIRSAIDRLVNAGFIEKSNYSKAGYDRTTWYTCLYDSGVLLCPTGQTHWPQRANPLDQKGQPITDSKPDIKTNKSMSPDGDGSAREKQTEIRNQAFEHFWQQWREMKKRINVKNHASKAQAKAKFLKVFSEQYVNKIGTDDFMLEIDALINDAYSRHDEIYQAQQRGERVFNPIQNAHPQNYLNGKTWRQDDD